MARKLIEVIKFILITIIIVIIYLLITCLQKKLLTLSEV